jgi:hypothetical protein
VDKIVHLIMWIFVGALLVLVVTHASGFSTAVTAVGGQVTNDASLLAGYAPAQPTSTKAASTNLSGTSGGSNTILV